MEQPVPLAEPGSAAGSAELWEGQCGLRSPSSQAAAFLPVGTQRGGSATAQPLGKGLALVPWPGEDTLWGSVGPATQGFVLLPGRGWGSVGEKEGGGPGGRVP